jgi:hypothetical protein
MKARHTDLWAGYDCAYWGAFPDFMIPAVCLWRETNVRRRVEVLFTTTVVILVVLAACRTRKASGENDKQAAMNVFLVHK